MKSLIEQGKLLSLSVGRAGEQCEGVIADIARDRKANLPRRVAGRQVVQCSHASFIVHHSLLSASSGSTRVALRAGK
jgi:hypothetical protein